LALRRQGLRGRRKGIAFEVTDRTRDAVKRILPFPLTSAQKRVLREIADDMRSPHPMNRLVQGDVGAGKTMVALLAMVVALENGCQAAFMAPTEILAEQHFLTFRRLLARCPYVVEHVSSALRGKERSAALARLADGRPPGRTPIRTILRPASERRSVIELVAREIAAGRQAYVVYPLVEESEKLEDVKAATQMAEEWRAALGGVQVGLLHGRLKSA